LPHSHVAASARCRIRTLPHPRVPHPHVAASARCRIPTLPHPQIAAWIAAEL
jgi:hypothetical protein